jgi:hypothetical protein
MPPSHPERTGLPGSVSSRHRAVLDSLAPPDDRASLAHVLREVDDSLHAVNVNVTQIIQRCQRLLDRLPDELPHRDVLHLRARVQGIEQCTRDAEQALARIRGRIVRQNRHPEPDLSGPFDVPPAVSTTRIARAPHRESER